MFTSCSAGEGKSTVVANTAMAMMLSEKKVLIIDCDLHRPTQHKLFQVDNRAGLTNYMVETHSLNEIIQKTTIPGLSIIPCGAIPPNPAEFLDLPKMDELLQTVKNQFDFVFVDTPPLFPVADACVLAPKVDGVVLVVIAQKIPTDVFRQAKKIIQKTNGHILEVVLNCVKTDRNSYYRYYRQPYYHL
jgi:capsular exopolysaccharide synthesis family protein